MYYILLAVVTIKINIALNKPLKKVIVIFHNCKNILAGVIIAVEQSTNPWNQWINWRKAQVTILFISFQKNGETN